MSYGDQLDAAAAALARAYTQLRARPPASPQARASAALARVRLYRSLELQVLTVGNVHDGELPPRGQIPQWWYGVGRSPVTRLAIELRQAAAATIEANWTARLDLPVAGQVARTLVDAADAVRTAGDILISNTGPAVGPGRAHRPRTSEGLAAMVGVGRADNLAALARLAAAAVMVDGPLARWLRPHGPADGVRAVLDAARRDVQRTQGRPLREAALLVASAGDGGRAPVRAMRAAPAVDDAARWSHPQSVGDCVDALDAARAWLFRYPDRVSIGQVATVASAAVVLTYCADHVRTRAGSGWPVASGEVAAADERWRAVLEACADLRSPVSASAEHTTAAVALRSAAAWLRGQLRVDGAWRDKRAWLSKQTRPVWRAGAAHLLARLPDLADVLRRAVRHAQERGTIVAPTGELRPQRGKLVSTPVWAPVPPEHESYQILWSALTGAGIASRKLAVVTGAPDRPGLAAADAADQQPAPHPAQLATQWYPQDESLSTSSRAPHPERSRPRNPPQPPPSRSR